MLRTLLASVLFAGIVFSSSEGLSRSAYDSTYPSLWSRGTLMFNFGNWTPPGGWQYNPPPPTSLPKGGDETSNQPPQNNDPPPSPPAYSVYNPCTDPNYPDIAFNYYRDLYAVYYQAYLNYGAPFGMSWRDYANANEYDQIVFAVYQYNNYNEYLQSLYEYYSSDVFRTMYETPQWNSSGEGGDGYYSKWSDHYSWEDFVNMMVYNDQEHRAFLPNCSGNDGGVDPGGGNDAGPAGGPGAGGGDD